MRKKIISILTLIVLLFSFSSCEFVDKYEGYTKDHPTTDSPDDSDDDDSPDGSDDGGDAVDPELQELINQYNSLLLKKTNLTNKYNQLLETKSGLLIENNDLKEELDALEETIDLSLLIFNNLCNEVLHCAVKVQTVYYNYETSMKGQIGSGSIIKEDINYYYALTNNHVIYVDETSGTYAHKEYSIFDYKGNEYEGTVLFSSPNYDMAVVRFPKGDLELKLITFADEDPNLSDVVFSIGESYGERNSIGYGNVSKYSNVSSSESDAASNITYKCVEHSAFIRSGNSGGMLINTNNELVGVNTYGTTPEDYSITGVGYASPITKVKEYLTANHFIWGVA